MKVLYVGAHPDDVEIGCAGTILKRREIDEAHCAVFSLCGQHSGLNFTADELKKELMNATDLMGFKKDHVHIWDFENTRLWKFTDEIREKLELLKEEIQPARVYVHTIKDTHQDHQTVAWAALRAFRLKEVRFYEIKARGPNMLYVFNPNVYVDISEHLKKKVQVLNCYQTQRSRPFFTREAWIKTAEFRGLACGVHAAEAFELVWRLE